MKKTVLSSLACIVVFNTLSHSTNNPVAPVLIENTQTQSVHDKLLNEFYEYFVDAQDPKQPQELNQKLANIKGVYEPYLEVLKNILDEEEIEIALGLIFSFEFYPYFLDSSIHLNDKLNYIFSKVIFQYLYFHRVNMINFVQELPELTKNHYLSLFKNLEVESILNVFYNFINELFASEQDSPLKNKALKIKEIFHPYMCFLNGLISPSEKIPTAIGFIFAYEYGPLLMENHSDHLRQLKKQIQPYLNALKKEKGSLGSYDYFNNIVSYYASTIPAIIPNSLADSILNEIFEFFKVKANPKFFSLDTNSQNIEQAFKTKELNNLKNCYNKDSFCILFNYIIITSFKMSHFILLDLSNNHETNGLKSIGEHKDGFTYLKISDFSERFNPRQIQTILSEVVQKNNPLILDLRDNPGGIRDQLMYFLSFFIPLDTVLAYSLDKNHQDFLGYKNLTRADCSPKKLKVMIEYLKENRDIAPDSFEVTIAQAKKLVENTKTIYKQHPEKLGEDLKNNPQQLEHLKDCLNFDFNFNNECLKGKIAILYNYNSYSSAQLATYFLKTFLAERVKIIGCNSSYKVTSSVTRFMPQSNLHIQYPIQELITLDYHRLEGKLQKPDIHLTDPIEMMKAAEEWVKGE